MLISLMNRWPVDKAKSFVIGDRQSDVQAGAAVGIRGALYTGGSLLTLVQKLIEE
jgi:D-glycero-D-manno-heptose 1,7-bisphosphate phosphatase